MTDRHRLEQLMALRERRERQAAAALREQQQRCQANRRRLGSVDAALAQQRDDFDRLEQTRFDPHQGTALSAAALEQARQAIDDHYRQQTAQETARHALVEEGHHLDRERARCRDEWTRRSHARHALGELLARRRRRDRLAEDGRAELEGEDAPPRGGR